MLVTSATSGKCDQLKGSHNVLGSMKRSLPNMNASFRLPFMNSKSSCSSNLLSENLHILHFMTTVLGVLLCFIPLTFFQSSKSHTYRTVIESKEFELVVRYAFLTSIPLILNSFREFSLFLSQDGIKSSSIRNVAVNCFASMSIFIPSCSLFAIIIDDQKTSFYFCIFEAANFLILGASLMSFHLNSNRLDNIIIFVIYAGYMIAQICRAFDGDVETPYYYFFAALAYCGFCFSCIRYFWRVLGPQNFSKHAEMAVGKASHIMDVLVSFLYFSSLIALHVYYRHLEKTIIPTYYALVAYGVALTAARLRPFEDGLNPNIIANSTHTKVSAVDICSLLWWSTFYLADLHDNYQRALTHSGKSVQACDHEGTGDTRTTPENEIHVHLAAALAAVVGPCRLAATLLCEAVASTTDAVVFSNSHSEDLLQQPQSAQAPVRSTRKVAQDDSPASSTFPTASLVEDGGSISFVRLMEMKSSYTYTSTASTYIPGTIELMIPVPPLQLLQQLLPTTAAKYFHQEHEKHKREANVDSFSVSDRMHLSEQLPEQPIQQPHNKHPLPLSSEYGSILVESIAATSSISLSAESTVAGSIATQADRVCTDALASTVSDTTQLGGVPLHWNRIGNGHVQGQVSGLSHVSLGIHRQHSRLRRSLAHNSSGSGSGGGGNHSESMVSTELAADIGGNSKSDDESSMNSKEESARLRQTAAAFKYDTASGSGSGSGSGSASGSVNVSTSVSASASEVASSPTRRMKGDSSRGSSIHSGAGSGRPPGSVGSSVGGTGQVRYPDTDEDEDEEVDTYVSSVSHGHTIVLEDGSHSSYNRRSVGDSKDVFSSTAARDSVTDGEIEHQQEQQLANLLVAGRSLNLSVMSRSIGNSGRDASDRPTDDKYASPYSATHSQGTAGTTAFDDRTYDDVSSTDTNSRYGQLPVHMADGSPAGRQDGDADTTIEAGKTPHLNSVSKKEIISIAYPGDTFSLLQLDYLASSGYIRSLTVGAKLQFRSIGFPGRPGIEEFMLLAPEIGSHLLITRSMLDQIRVDILNLAETYALVLSSVEDLTKPQMPRKLDDCMQLVMALTTKISDTASQCDAYFIRLHNTGGTLGSIRMDGEDHCDADQGGPG